MNINSRNSTGHPLLHVTGVIDGDGPMNGRYPIQETTQHDEDTELDGFKSILGTNLAFDPKVSPQSVMDSAAQSGNVGKASTTGYLELNIPLQQMNSATNAARYQHAYDHTQAGYWYDIQSSSGFSQNRMNLPSGGNLQELPSVGNFHLLQRQENLFQAPDVDVPPVYAALEAELRQELGDDQYETLFRRCYESHRAAGREHAEALAYASHFLSNEVMCITCKKWGTDYNQHFTHNTNCVLAKCLRKIANPVQAPNGHNTPFVATTLSTATVPQNQPYPRPERNHTPLRFSRRIDLSVYQTANQSQHLHVQRENVGGKRRSERNNENHTPAQPETTTPENRFESGMEKPKSSVNFSQFSDHVARFKTFQKRWPSSSKQSPRKLANAGFFFTGDADVCKCFHCGIELRQWEEDDDPVEQHELWSPDCGFIRDMMATPNIDIEKQMQAVAKPSVGEREPLPYALDPDICGVCCRKKIEVTQLYCRHIVCRECLPTQGQDRKYRCRLCREEVVKTSAYDANCKPWT